MPRPSNTEARKRQIVEALMTVMATSGYAGATIPLIAKEAGLTSGLVHYHFDSKQSILIALVQHMVELIDVRFRAINTKDPVEQLCAYIDAHLALGDGSNQTAVACWINIGAECTSQIEVRAAYQKATEHQISMLETMCQESLQFSGRSTKNKRAMALGITAAIEGCYRLLVSAPDMIPTGFAAPTVKAMARGLISEQPMASTKRRT